MPYTTFTPGFGSIIAYATATFATGAFTVGGSYTKVAQTIDITGPEDSVGKIKVTNNDSPNNSHEYRPGMIDPGEISWECIYTESQFAILKAMEGDGNVYSWKETFADGSTHIVLGYLAKMGHETKTEDEAVKGKMTVQAISKGAYALS